MTTRRTILIVAAILFLAVAIVLRSGFFAVAFYALLAIAGLAYLMTFTALRVTGRFASIHACVPPATTTGCAKPSFANFSAALVARWPLRQSRYTGWSF